MPRVLLAAGRSLLLMVLLVLVVMLLLLLEDVLSLLRLLLNCLHRRFRRSVRKPRPAPRAVEVGRHAAQLLQQLHRWQLRELIARGLQRRGRRVGRAEPTRNSSRNHRRRRGSARARAGAVRELEARLLLLLMLILRGCQCSERVRP